MQKVMSIGYLGRDPEVKYANRGQLSPSSLSLPWNDGRTSKEWFAVKAFDRLAEIAGTHFKKASRVCAEGRKRTESWDDKQTGAKHYRDFIYVDRIEFLDSKGSGNGQWEPAESAFDETTVTDQEIPF